MKMVAAGILGVVVSCTNRNGHIPFHSGVPTNRDKKNAYYDEATIKDRRWIKDKFWSLGPQYWCSNVLI